MLKLQNMPNAKIAPSAILKMENQEQFASNPKDAMTEDAQVKLETSDISVKKKVEMKEKVHREP